MKNNYLKLLFISADKFPPFRVDVTVLFGKEIVNRGHVIDWLMQSDRPLDHTFETQWYGGKAIVGPTDTGTSILSRIKLHFLSIFHDVKMFRILQSKRYDIILVKDKFISGLLAIVASRMFSVKFVYWLSFPFPEDSFFRVKEKTVKYPLLYWLRGFAFYLLLYRIILPRCDHAFVQTEYMKSNIAKKGISIKKMTAVPMAVSIKDVPFYGHNQKEENPQNGPVVVYLGTLIKIRRMDFLLRSFKILLTREKNARLYLVGGSEDPSDEKLLKAEAKKLGIDHAVTLTGFLPQEEAWQYVKKASVCVSPIYPSPIFDVGSPTKLLEYMAMGKAAVANDHPEQQVVLSESKAGICVPYDERAFSEAILYLIKHQDIAHQMGIRGRKYIEERRNYSQTSAVVEKKLLNIINWIES